MQPHNEAYPGIPYIDVAVGATGVTGGGATDGGATDGGATVGAGGNPGGNPAVSFPGNEIPCRAVVIFSKPSLIAWINLSLPSRTSPCMDFKASFDVEAAKSLLTRLLILVFDSCLEPPTCHSRFWNELSTC